MSTGADLEAAVMAAARVYQQQDRAELAKQHTPKLHGGLYAGKAPIDMKGWLRVGDHREPFYAECKATTEGKVAFRDGSEHGGISEKQLEAMRDAVRRAITMVLIVDCVPENEVYVVAVHHIVRFAQWPWRKSLSLHWLRAYGEVARVTIDGKTRRVWFLETAPHENRIAAQAAVEAERAKANGVVELFPVEVAPSKKRAQRFATRPTPGTDEHKEYVRQLADEGLRRQMGARPKAFGQRRKGWR